MRPQWKKNTLQAFSIVFPNFPLSALQLTHKRLRHSVFILILQHVFPLLGRKNLATSSFVKGYFFVLGVTLQQHKSIIRTRAAFHRIDKRKLPT